MQRKVLPDGRRLDAVDQVDAVQRNVWLWKDVAVEKLRQSGTEEWGTAVSGFGE